ncbi:MAG: hypothetical protein FWC79_00565 [Oscillospiraceae bacterium]|nr:hypothetical protein [Oscillospiraceae bacterium]
MLPPGNHRKVFAKEWLSVKSLYPAKPKTTARGSSGNNTLSLDTSEN